MAVSEYALPAIGNLATAFAQYFGGSYKRSQRKKLPALESDLNQGISSTDIQALAPLVKKSIMPNVNQIAGSASGRFGSRSNIVAGSALGSLNQYLTPALAELYRMQLTNNQANKRLLYSTTAGMAQ